MNKKPNGLYTMQQRIIDAALFAAIVLFFGYAIPCALVGELIGF